MLTAPGRSGMMTLHGFSSPAARISSAEEPQDGGTVTQGRGLFDYGIEGVSHAAAVVGRVIQALGVAEEGKLAGAPVDGGNRG